MILQNTSDLIAQVTHQQLPSGIPVDVAQLVNGSALVISADALGNGLVRSIDLPLTLTQENGAFLQEHKAGYVGLSGGVVLLITLNDIQVFSSKEDALRNRNELIRMSLAI